MGNTMFGKAKHKRLADIISIRSVPEAEISVQKLEQEFDSAPSQKNRLIIARAVGLAGNRALASAKRRNVSKRERAELRQVADIYGKLASSMYERYRTGGRLRVKKITPPMPRLSPRPPRITPKMVRIS